MSEKTTEEGLIRDLHLAELGKLLGGARQMAVAPLSRGVSENVTNSVVLLVRSLRVLYAPASAERTLQARTLASHVPTNTAGRPTMALAASSEALARILADDSLHRRALSLLAASRKPDGTLGTEGDEGPTRSSLLFASAIRAWITDSAPSHGNPPDSFLT